MKAQTKLSAQEFVMWMKGFVEAANTYNITPAQWDAVKEKLKEVSSVDDNIKATRYLLDSYNTNTTTTNNPSTI